MRRRQLARVDGSVLVWSVGLTLVVTFALGAAIDVVGLVKSVRELQAVADRAALAAVNRLDLTSLQTTGKPFLISIDKSAALAVINAQLASYSNPVKLKKFVAVGLQVEVEVTRNWQGPTFGISHQLTASTIAEATLSGAPAP